MRLRFSMGKDLDVIARKPSSLVIQHAVPPTCLKLVEHFDDGTPLERKGGCVGAYVIIKASHPDACGFIDEALIWLLLHPVHIPGEGAGAARACRVKRFSGLIGCLSPRQKPV